MAASAIRFPNGRVEALFGSTTRARLLGVLFQFPGRHFFISELAGLIRRGYAVVWRQLRQLERLQVVRRSGGRYRVFYQVNRRLVLFQVLRQLLRKAAKS